MHEVRKTPSNGQDSLEDGHWVVRRQTSPIATLYGSVEPTQRPEDFDALRAAFEQGVADDIMASMARERGARD